jgi:hypothetical protein
MKKYFLSEAIIFFILNNTWAQVKNNAIDEVAVKQLFYLQNKAWNNGDIEGYMQGYWQHDSLMFVGKSGITYGWQNTFNNYKKSYPDTASMGKLKIDLVSIQQLNKTNFFIVGKWYLVRGIGNISGAFTLLIKKIKGKWVIVTDHSS